MVVVVYIDFSRRRPATTELRVACTLSRLIFSDALLYDAETIAAAACLLVATESKGGIEIGENGMSVSVCLSVYLFFRSLSS